MTYKVTYDESITQDIYNDIILDLLNQGYSWLYEDTCYSKFKKYKCLKVYVNIKSLQIIIKNRYDDTTIPEYDISKYKNSTLLLSDLIEDKLYYCYSSYGNTWLFKYRKDRDNLTSHNGALKLIGSRTNKGDMYRRGRINDNDNIKYIRLATKEELTLYI